MEREAMLMLMLNPIDDNERLIIGMNTPTHENR